MQVLSQANVSGKYVLVRGDLDVPLKKQGVKSKKQNWKVADDFRLRAMLPTLRWLVQHRAKVILIGHLGRPHGRLLPELTLAPIAQHLPLLGIPVYYQALNHVKMTNAWEKKHPPAEVAPASFAQYDNHRYHYDQEAIRNFFRENDPDEILLLENLRFDQREEENQDAFAQELAHLSDIYVNECFATSHRPHASFVGVPKYLPSFSGFRLNQEVEVLSKVFKNPRRPLVFVVGGRKTETKIPLVKKIAPWADAVLLGGKLMFTKELEGVPHVRFPVNGTRIDDIGPKTITLFTEILRKAQTVVWNGPLGRYEDEQYLKGTAKIAQTIISSKAQSVVGGGETIAALDKLGLRDQMGWISTGGGALLQFLAEGTLPGLKALTG